MFLTILVVRVRLVGTQPMDTFANLSSMQEADAPLDAAHIPLVCKDLASAMTAITDHKVICHA
jgi:hypothetical protein